MGRKPYHSPWTLVGCGAWGTKSWRIVKETGLKWREYNRDISCLLERHETFFRQMNI